MVSKIKQWRNLIALSDESRKWRCHDFHTLSPAQIIAFHPGHLCIYCIYTQRVERRLKRHESMDIFPISQNSIIFWVKFNEIKKPYHKDNHYSKLSYLTLLIQCSSRLGCEHHIKARGWRHSKSLVYCEQMCASKKWTKAALVPSSVSVGGKS